MLETIDTVALGIKGWADRVFPDRTDASMYLKLYGEIAEMIDADDAHVEGEVADVLILILDFAKRKGIDVEAAIARKMKINQDRSWVHNKLGAFSHRKENNHE
jgi:hypothetical protein